jgi:hypothetical protein
VGCESSTALRSKTLSNSRSRADSGLLFLFRLLPGEFLLEDLLVEGVLALPSLSTAALPDVSASGPSIEPLNSMRPERGSSLARSRLLVFLGIRIAVETVFIHHEALLLIATAMGDEPIDRRCSLRYLCQPPPSTKHSAITIASPWGDESSIARSVKRKPDKLDLSLVAACRAVTHRGPHEVACHSKHCSRASSYPHISGSTGCRNRRAGSH